MAINPQLVANELVRRDDEKYRRNAIYEEKIFEDGFLANDIDA